MTGPLPLLVALAMSDAAAATAPGSAAAADGPPVERSVSGIPSRAGDPPGTGGKLLLTGGVTQIEGAAGGGLTPWAVIGGMGTRDQVGGTAFYTRVAVDAYHLESFGALVGFRDRVEVSVSRQRFDTEAVGGALGLGDDFVITQDTLGVKVRVAGDAVLEQDSPWPQIAVGLQAKRNDRGALLAAIGARDDDGIDAYVSATKLFLDAGVLLSGTVRFTRANQFGILGFGGDRNDDHRAQFEGSAAWLPDRRLAIGAEYRMKPDNLGIAGEDDAWDVFVAWQPNRHVALTVAWVDLGDIVIREDQRGAYASLQIGF